MTENTDENESGEAPEHGVLGDELDIDLARMSKFRRKSYDR